MKAPIVIGIVIAAAVVAAGFVAPNLRSAQSKTAEQTLVQATKARRQLHRYDTYLPRLQRHAQLATLKEADLEALIEKSQETFDQLNQESSEAVRRLRARDERMGLPPSEVQPFRANASGVRAAIGSVEQLLRDNQALLTQAAQDARSASRDGPTVLGVANAEGMVEYVRAAALLAEAQELRRQLDTREARLLALGAEWKLAQGHGDLYAGLDVSEVLVDLQTDLEEIEALQTDARVKREALAAQVAERETALAEAQAELQQARTELLELEERGFVAGNDESFNAYRTGYVALNQRLRTLQEQEQLLTYGGTKDVELDDEDLLVGEIRGAGPLYGLEELRRRLVIAQEREKRLTTAKKGLTDRVAYVRESGRTAEQEEGRYTSRLAELRSRQEALMVGFEQLAADAFKKEDEALKAAQAANAWKGDAQSLQGRREANRQNPRLKMIVEDRYVSQVDPSAEAAAQTLLGRIYAQRITAVSKQISVLERFADITGGTFDAQPLKEVVDVARDEALKALEKASSTYERLVNSTPTTAKWLPQAGLATVYYLLSTVDTAQAAEHLSMAASTIQAALEGREQSPYVRAHVSFRDHLRRANADAFTAPEREPDRSSDETTREDEG
ncbi:MAG: hypothetical protein KKB50_07005 [Planctomycetes bacterium]|nr:hypothetical protein [Planctomycetota bacterium]